MPHFFFHLHDGKSRLEDRRGASLPDAEAAWYQAYRCARDIVIASDRTGCRHWISHALEVEDDRGGIVCTMPLSEVAELVA